VPTTGGREGLEAWEQRLWAEGFQVVAGTDEAGRGPLAGPVVAGAFAMLDREDAEVREVLAKVADSKGMTEEQREEVYKELTDPRFKGRIVWAVAEAPATEIDSSNILRAALSAMARAVQALEVRPDCVLVDGCNRPPELLRPGEQWTRGPKAAEQAKNDVKQKRLSSFFTATKPAAPPSAPEPQGDGESAWRPRRVEAVVGGDGLVPCISAASILAKVHRDRLMARLHEAHPEYGFDVHKGYPTAAHLEAIRAHGVCPEHRRSFGPVRQALGLDADVESATPPRRGLLEAFGLGAPAPAQQTPQAAPGAPAPAPAAGVAQPPASATSPAAATAAAGAAPARRGRGRGAAARGGTATAATEENETPEKKRAKRAPASASAKEEKEAAGAGGAERRTAASCPGACVGVQ